MFFKGINPKYNVEENKNDYKNCHTCQIGGFCIVNFLVVFIKTILNSWSILTDSWGPEYVFLIFFNSHKFSLTRETDTKKAEQFFKDSILSYTQKNIWHFANWQSLCFGQFYHFRIEVLQNCWPVYVCQIPWWDKIWENWEKIRNT